jgi:hypothetical protein
VERCSAALAEDDVEEAAERLPADEERQRLVLVGRPARELEEQERADRRGAEGDAAEEESAVELPPGGSDERGDAGCEGGVGRGPSPYAAEGGFRCRC